jgi:hypothetical protein
MLKLNAEQELEISQSSEGKWARQDLVGGHGCLDCLVACEKAIHHKAVSTDHNISHVHATPSH